MPTASYDVTLRRSRRKKLYADGKGKETEAPIDEPFDIGAFTAEPGKTGLRGRVGAGVVASSASSAAGRPVTLTSSTSAPTWVGVDPYNKRIDRNSDDNLKAVSAQP